MEEKIDLAIREFDRAELQKKSEDKFIEKEIETAERRIASPEKALIMTEKLDENKIENQI